MSDPSYNYKAAGRIVREAIERHYGKAWQQCFRREVATALVAREVFFVMLGNARPGLDSVALVEHGREMHEAALRECGLSDE